MKGPPVVIAVFPIRDVAWTPGTKAKPSFYLRNSVHTLEILQDLGFLYHIDDPSRDEPFITPIRGKDFVTVPYTFHLNDLILPPFQGYDPGAYVQTLTDEFDQLYAEAATRRRMMVIAMRDQVSDHAARVRALDHFLTYARGHEDVWFARKDEIARWALQGRAQTPIINRGPAGITGLPGPSKSRQASKRSSDQAQSLSDKAGRIGLDRKFWGGWKPLEYSLPLLAGDNAKLPLLSCWSEAIHRAGGESFFWLNNAAGSNACMAV